MSFSKNSTLYCKKKIKQILIVILKIKISYHSEIARALTKSIYYNTSLSLLIVLDIIHVINIIGHTHQCEFLCAFLNVNSSGNFFYKYHKQIVFFLSYVFSSGFHILDFWKICCKFCILLFLIDRFQNCFGFHLRILVHSHLGNWNAWFQYVSLYLKNYDIPYYKCDTCKVSHL